MNNLTKHHWYGVIIRFPAYLQENLEQFAPIAFSKSQWDAVMLHYWTLRLNKINHDPVSRMRDAVLKHDNYTPCEICKRPFTEKVSACWVCWKYTCRKCVSAKLQDAFPNSVPTSCLEHTSACDRCSRPFIPKTREKHCFQCQYETQMFTVSWINLDKNSTLPYGTATLRQTFVEYLSKFDRTRGVTPGVYNNAQILVGANGVIDGYAIGTNAITLGVASIAIGTNAFANNGNNNNDNNLYG